MATTPLRRCSAPGCRSLIREGSRCATHSKGKHNTKNRPGDPFYSSAAWIRIRNLRRLMNPLCQECEKQGRVKAMHAVDHIEPRSERPDLELDIDNTQSLCEHCHNAVKQRQERASAKASQ